MERIVVMVVVITVELILIGQVGFDPETGGEVSFVWKVERDPQKGECWVKGKVSTGERWGRQYFSLCP